MRLSTKDKFVEAKEKKARIRTKQTTRKEREFIAKLNDLFDIAASDSLQV